MDEIRRERTNKFYDEALAYLRAHNWSATRLEGIEIRPSDSRPSCSELVVRFTGTQIPLRALASRPLSEMDMARKPTKAELARADAFEAAAQIAEHLNADHIAKCIRLAAAVPMARQ